MMLIVVSSSLWVKIAAITAFAYYAFLCFNTLHFFGSPQELLTLVQDYFVIWLAVEGVMDAHDKEMQVKMAKSKVKE